MAIDWQLPYNSLKQPHIQCHFHMGMAVGWDTMRAHARTGVSRVEVKAVYVATANDGDRHFVLTNKPVVLIFFLNILHLEKFIFGISSYVI